MILINLNGENKEIDSGLSLEQLVKNLELDTKKIAIELNFEIINPQDFANIKIQDGAKIEIVHFIGGG